MKRKTGLSTKSGGPVKSITMTTLDGFGPFSDGFGRFRTVFGSFRIVFRRVPAVLDDSNPNLKNFKFQLATAAVPSAVPFRPPSRGQLKFENLRKNWKKNGKIFYSKSLRVSPPLRDVRLGQK